MLCPSGLLSFYSSSSHWSSRLPFLLFPAAFLCPLWEWILYGMDPGVCSASRRAGVFGAGQSSLVCPQPLILLAPEQRLDSALNSGAYGDPFLLLAPPCSLPCRSNSPCPPPQRFPEPWMGHHTSSPVPPALCLCPRRKPCSSSCPWRVTAAHGTWGMNLGSRVHAASFPADALGEGHWLHVRKEGDHCWVQHNLEVRPRGLTDGMTSYGCVGMMSLLLGDRRCPRV